MLEILMEHLCIWTIALFVSVACTEDFKTAIKCMILFMLVLYSCFGLFYIAIINGGHIII